jgi:hypothetical protein
VIDHFSFLQNYIIHLVRDEKYSRQWGSREPRKIFSLANKSGFFCVMFFPQIRTKKSGLNLRESNFHDFKSSWNYNYDCLPVWIWNQRNYIQNFLHDFWVIIFNQIQTSQIIFASNNQLHHKVWPANSLSINGFVWVKVRSTSNSCNFGRHAQCYAPTHIHFELLHTLTLPNSYFMVYYFTT